MPSPSEYQLMKRMFAHLTPELKQQYMMEFSHTILGSRICALCSNFDYNKKKCIHFNCPGMCEDCYNNMGDMCPLCKKEQKIECPICQETKTSEKICILKNCRHPICYKCFTESAMAKKLIKKCPICRESEIF